MQSYHFAGHWNPLCLVGDSYLQCFGSVYICQTPVATFHSLQSPAAKPTPRPHPNRKPGRLWAWREGAAGLRAPPGPPPPVTSPPAPWPHGPAPFPASQYPAAAACQEAMEGSQPVAARQGEEASCSSWGAGRWEDVCGREEARRGGQDPEPGFLLLPLRRAGSAREAAGLARAGPGRLGERAVWVWRRGLRPLRLPASLRKKPTYRPFQRFLSSGWGLPFLLPPSRRTWRGGRGSGGEFWSESLGVSFPDLVPDTFPPFDKVKAKLCCALSSAEILLWKLLPEVTW